MLRNEVNMLKLENVRKTYGSLVAVDDLSFTVKDGKIFGLLGENGAGKTTTFRMIMGLLEPDKGTITLDGKKHLLKSSDIVITDSMKSVCVAGVMGGENTEVDDNTKTILIESAIFDAVSIRYTANHLDLKSEASIRYGKGLNYEYTEKALLRACHLLQKHGFYLYYQVHHL